MRIRSFDYYPAADFDDALLKIRQYGPEARILAGGTDLVPAMKKKKILPAVLVSIRKVKELDYVRRSGSEVRIGSMTKHTDLAADPLLNKYFPILCEAVSLIGSWQIRNIATIGGNLSTASPAADSAGPLLALDARVVIADSSGESEIPLSSFFKGPGETIIGRHQLLKEIILRIPEGLSAGCYMKLMRKRAVDLSVAGVAFQAELDSGGKRLSAVAIGLGGVAPTPIRATDAESALTGLSYSEAVDRIAVVAEKAVRAASPISDVRASAGYRRTMIGVYVRRAAGKILGKLFDQET